MAAPSGVGELQLFSNPAHGIAPLPTPARPGLYVVQLLAPDGRRYSARLLRE